MNRKKQLNSKLSAVFFALLSIILLFNASPQAAKADGSDCSDVYTPLSNFVNDGVNSNKSFYVRAMNETGVPWEMLAAIHYRETGFSHTNPGNGQGIFQFANGYGGPYPPGDVSDDEFYRQLVVMANKVQDDYVWRGSVPRERRRLQPNETNVAIVKDTLFSYNGRAGVYADQAVSLGYNRDAQPYEGSPYVMNRFDCARSRMGMITRDYGSLDGTDTRYGAFTIFARLRGDDYWRNLKPFDNGFPNPTLITPDNGDPRQYIIYNNTLYLIASPEVKVAWGLANTPLTHVIASYMGSLPNGPIITRVVRADSDPTMYLVDNGAKYGFPTAQIMSNWNTSAWDPGTGGASVLPKAVTDLVGTSNALGQVIHAPDGAGPTMYFVDGSTLHPIDNPDTLNAWQGNTNLAIVPSSALFSRYTVGSSVSTFKVQSGSGQNFVVDAGQKLPADSTTFNAIPGPVATVGDPLLNSLATGPNATPFIRASNDPTVYLLDNGQKHSVASPAQLMAYSNNGQIPVNIVTQGHTNKIAQGASVDGFLAQNSSRSTTYLMNGTKQPIPAGQVSDYTTGGHNPLTLSDAILSLMQSGPTVTRFVRVPGQPGVSIIANGNYKTFPTPQDFALWGGNSTQITNISQEALTQFNFTGAVTAYVSDGTNNYLLGKPGIMYGIDSGTANNWRLSGSPTQLSPASLSGLNNGGLLPSAFKIGSNVYLMRKNVGYNSSDSNLLTLWGLNGNLPDLDPSVSKFFVDRPLTKYVTSGDAGDGKIYLISESAFLHIANPSAMLNLGYHGEGVVDVNTEDITVTSKKPIEWNNTIVGDGAGNFFVIDSGVKRRIDASAVGQWTNNQTLAVQAFSQALFSQFGSGPTVLKSIQADGDTKIYAVINGQKQWITSPQTFIQGGFAPSSTVSPLLRDTLQTGSHI